MAEKPDEPDESHSVNFYVTFTDLSTYNVPLQDNKIKVNFKLRYFT